MYVVELRLAQPAVPVGPDAHVRLERQDLALWDRVDAGLVL